MKSKKSKPLVSVIIPVRKIGDYIHNHVPKILEMNYKNIEIIIVSEFDETIKFPKTKIVKVGRVNPAAKRNVGVEASSGTIVAFIDDDAYPIKEWLDYSIPYFDDMNVCAVAGPQLIPKESTFFQWVSGYVYALGSGSQKYVYSPTKFQYIDDYPTCNLIVRKSYFKEIHGFNTDYWGGEDTKLCYDLTQKLKKKIVYDPNVVVYHHRRKRLMDHIRQTTMWSIYRGYFSRKFPETSFRLIYFLPTLFFSGVLFGGLFSFFYPILRIPYFLVIGVYLLYCLAIASKVKSFKYFFPVFLLLIATQITYGAGVVVGIIRNKSLDKTFNPAEKLDIN